MDLRSEDPVKIRIKKQAFHGCFQRAGRLFSLAGF